MKHLKVFIFAAFALISTVVIRCIQLIFLTDPKTGFYVEGMESIGTTLMVFLILIIAFSALLAFISKKERLDPIPTNSVILGCAALLSGLSHLIEPILSDAHFGAVPPLLITLRLIAIIVAGLVLCWYGIAILINKKPSPTLSVFLIIAWVLRLMTTFISFTGMSNISENLYDVLMLVTTLIFMLYFGKSICGVFKTNTYRTLIATGVASVLFTSASAIPFIILSLAGNTKFVHTPIDSPVTGLFTAIFISVYLINICSKKDA